ncbi:MAG: hypothetical protein WCJ30_24905, partial [Deltaproteobacteria bacterium]
ASCGGATQGTHTTTNDNAVQQAQRARPADQTPDVSEVPAPADLLATMRLSSVNQVIERVGALTGMGDMIRSQVDEMIGNWHGGLANLFDRSAPVDLVVIARGRNDVDVVFAFGGPSMDEIERGLANSHRLVPLPNGVRRLETTTPPSQSSSTQNCFASPTPRPAVTRIVCSDHANVAESVLPYVARTLTRREVAANALTFEVSMDVARRNLVGDAIRQLAQGREQFDQNISGRSAGLDPALRDALIPLAHDALDALQGLLTDPTRYYAALTFGADRITLHQELDLQTPHSTLLQAIINAARPQGPVPPAMLAHLMPGGYVYAAGTFDETGLQPSMQRLIQIGEMLIAHDTALDAADQAALRAALDAIPQLGRLTEAMSMGADAEGHPWVTAGVHSPTMQSAQWIASTRAMLAAMRRPHIQGEIRRLLALANVTLPDLGALRELAVTGLPAGTLLVQFPSFRALTEAAMGRASSAPPPAAAPARGRRPRRGAAAAPVDPGTQLLIAPDGADAVMTMGRDARAIYTQYMSNTTPGVDPQYVSSPGAAMVSAMVLGGLPNLMRATSERESRQLATALQALPDHGS